MLKNFILGILAIFTISTLAYSDDTIVVGVPDSLTAATLANLSSGNFNQSYGYLHEDEDGTSSFYCMSTENVFYQWTTMDLAVSDNNVSASLVTHDITLSAGAEGQYQDIVHGSFKANSGSTVTITTFVNNTAVDSVQRLLGAGPSRNPTFINLSSGATYDTYSAISRLEAADSDLITINESAVNTPGFDIEFRFIDVISPESVHFENVGYDGSAGHDVEMLAWDYENTVWVDMRSDTTDFPHTGTYGATTAYLRTFMFPSPTVDYVDASGNVKVRLTHTDAGTGTHDMIFDQVSLQDGHSSAVISFDNIETLVAGDVITIKFKADTADTDLYIDSMGLNKIRVSQ